MNKNLDSDDVSSHIFKYGMTKHVSAEWKLGLCYSIMMGVVVPVLLLGVYVWTEWIGHVRTASGESKALYNGVMRIYASVTFLVLTYSSTTRNDIHYQRYHVTCLVRLLSFLQSLHSVCYYSVSVVDGISDCTGPAATLEQCVEYRAMGPRK